MLEVIYLIFNEGYSATAGDDWLRPELCAEALRLGRVLAALAPDEPEVHGLVALMEFQSSRLRARIGPSGEPVLLLDQDRRTWDRLHINRGVAALAGRTRSLPPRALRAPGGDRRMPRPRLPPRGDGLGRARRPLRRVGPRRRRRRSWSSTARWPSLWRLARTRRSALVDQLVETETLERYHLLYSVRGDLLDRLGRHDEAALEFDRAAELAANAAGARHSARQRAEAARGAPDPLDGSAVTGDRPA